MIKFNSLFTKITIKFLISISLLIALFIFYLKIEKDLQIKPIITYHNNISNSVRQKRLKPDDLATTLENLNFEIVYEPYEVLNNAKIIHSARGFETVFYKGDYFIHITTPRFRMLFKDLTIYENTHEIYYVFIAIFIVLIFFYIWLIVSLKPLKDLKNCIEKFSKGDLTVSCRSLKDDEIAQVANEFDNAVRKIELLLESRQLFLRTIMHELKTPIAKGRIVSELVSDEKQRNRMNTIFERLDFLINDFAKIEQVITNNYELHKYNFTLKDILNKAKSMLLIEDGDDKLQINIDESKKIMVDNDLIALVFKNLIDNGLKYSKDGKVVIEQKENTICFISKGEKLQREFEEYFMPFHNTTKSKNHGMGLGLYIVKSILDRHEMKFEYEYIEDTNIFKVLI